MVTSTTKVWPSRFSKSSTPWWPLAEIPLRTIWSVTGVPLSVVRVSWGVLDGLGDPHGVERRGDVVHPHAPGAEPRSVHRRRGRRHVAVQGRPGVVARGHP